MAANAFRTALGRCGYDNATVGYLTQQGFTTTDQFLEFPINEVKPMLKTLAKNLPAGVTLPYQFNLKFLASECGWNTVLSVVRTLMLVLILVT